jgi:serine protease
VPLRFPRPATAGAAACLAAALTVLGTMPASADSVRQHEWWLAKLGVASSWRTTRGAGVTVAVLADGVSSTVPDLANSVTAGPDLTRSGRAASGIFFGLQGTPIASLIAGHGHGTDNSEGVIGVAPAARILSVRVTLSPGDSLLSNPTVTAGEPAAIAAGIRYAVGHGASVIDLPLDPGQPAASGTGSAPAVAAGSAAEAAAVAYARRQGVLLVAPAGDNGAGSDAVNYPAGYPGVIRVGAFDHDFTKASYSNHQPYVTLTAAGTGVIAATEPGSYATMNSTGAASAIVAGIAALIRSRFPGLSPAQVRRALDAGTRFRRPGGIEDGSGYGAANAARALTKASVIAGPLGQRPSARATAQRAPTPPPVSSTASSLATKVLRAVVISAGVLIALLLPITAYAAVGRRRARRVAHPGWERDPALERLERLNRLHRRGPADRARTGTDAADSMLEYFSAPARPPAAAADPPPAGRPAARAPAGRPPRGPVPALGPIPPLGQVSLPAAPRSAARQPRVSGAPPWEPAPRPDSEFPWGSGSPSPPVRPASPAVTANPAPASHRLGPRQPPPSAAAAPAAASSGAAAGPWASAPVPGQDGQPGQAAGPGAEQGRGAGQGQRAGQGQGAGQGRGAGQGPDPDRDADPGTGPIYMWNPGASTESFSVVPRDEDEY